MLAERIKKRRKEKKLTQEYMAKKLGITRQGYGHYETGRNEPDNQTLLKIAEILDCTIDYLYGLTDIPNLNVTVAGKEITLTPEEYKLFEELRKHPILFHDLASDPEKKVKELIKLYKMKKILLEEDEEEYGEGFGELDD